MNPENWSQIERLYYAALERRPESRASFLDEVCAGDEELRREVASLLASTEQVGRFLATPIGRTVAELIAHEPRSSSIGQQIGHYQVLSMLGSGGMAEVYLARDTRLGREVALKLLPIELTDDSGRLRRFAQEARAASALNHPNIITIHEIGQVGGTHYMVTEYVEGETLRQRIKAAPQQKMAVSEALDVAVQIATALTAAHRKGITHRDIKPENVMIRADGIVKVLDFGLAKLTEPELPAIDAHDAPNTSSTESGMVIGTLRYMSPEQARGEKVDGRTDIFSLGVVFYEMLTGRPPFSGATANETMAAILRDEPLPVTHKVPAGGGLERIISRTLRKAPSDRYQTAKDLLDDLKELKQRIELQTRLGEIGSAIEPSGERSGAHTTAAEGSAGHASRKPGGFFTPAIRALAGWALRNRKFVLTEKDLILLADFENKTGDTVFDATLKQGLAIQFQQSPFLSLFPEERVRQTLRLMKRSSEERVTASIAREICVRHNLKALIAGSIVPLGSRYVITLEAIHGQNGETLHNEQVEAKSKEHVLRALSQAATRLRAKLGESLSSIHQFDKGLEETTTNKLEAFQAYSLGYEQSLNGRMLDAIQLYRRAVELDPDFAYAWSMMSIHHNIGGRPGLAAEYAEKAYALKNRVSDYEQLAITFRYHFIFTGDMNKARDAAILFKRTYPRTSNGPIDLLVAYDLLGQHELAVAEGREAVRLNPSYAPAYWYLGRALVRVNRFAEAKEVFKRALEQKFDLINIHATLYVIGFTEGETTAMQQQLDWANGNREEYVLVDAQSGAAAFSGEWRKAQEFSRRAIDLAARGETKELAARFAADQALRGAVLDDIERAKADADETLKIARGRASLPRAALALALSGETNEVNSLIGELGERYPEDTVINSIWLPTIRAALELEAGNPANTVHQLQTTTIYEAAAEFWPQYLRGLAYLKLGKGSESVAEFQKILDHRGHAPVSPLYPLARLGLARATALTRDAMTSRNAINDFFAAWNKADVNLPILIEAKKDFETL